MFAVFLRQAPRVGIRRLTGREEKLVKNIRLYFDLEVLKVCTSAELSLERLELLGPLHGVPIIDAGVTRRARRRTPSYAV